MYLTLKILHGNQTEKISFILPQNSVLSPKPGDTNYCAVFAHLIFPHGDSSKA